MNKRQIDDILDEHSQALSGEETDALWLRAAPEAALLLAPLFALARELAQALLPLSPRPEFREQLYRGLVRSAQEQQAQRTLGLLPAESRWPDHSVSDTAARVATWLDEQTSDPNRRWVFGAAAVGSALSLAGILAYLLRRQGNRTASSA